MTIVSQLLRDNSIMIIGERKADAKRISWIQLYDPAETDEVEIRLLLSEIGTHITKKRIKSGSARKFIDGKLMFVEKFDQSSQQFTVYCLFTEEMNLENSHKKAFKAIIDRGGLYSAKRFFSEFLDLVSNRELLDSYQNITLENALKLIDNYTPETINLGTIARVISIVNRSENLDFTTLEKMFTIVYEAIQFFSSDQADPDEFLDAAFNTAILYEEHGFHLAMELYKRLIPLAIKNKRYNLEVTCRLRLCLIFKEQFPDAGQLMINQLDSVNVSNTDLTRKNLEEYYVIRGHAYYEMFDFENAKQNYLKAIEISNSSIASPKMLADAYSILASLNFQDFRYREASRQYLTASAIAFSMGDISSADRYSGLAALPDIFTSLTIAYQALAHRMDGRDTDAEFSAWESLRILLYAYMHSIHGNAGELMDTAGKILSYTEAVLSVKGKKRKNQKIIRDIKNLMDKIMWQSLKPGTEFDAIQKVLNQVNLNIPLSAPTFMLLSTDGRLIMMGTVYDSGWEESDIKGVILSGIISAITSLIGEISDSQRTELKTIDAGNYQILLEVRDYTISALLVDRDLPVFRKRLNSISDYIADEYNALMKRGWDGANEPFHDLIDLVEITFAPSIIALQL